MRVRDWSEVDFYAVLGVDADASADTISEAFRALAKRLHPDVAGGAGADAVRFTEVTAAYDVLSDPERRRDYDRVRAETQPRAAAPLPTRHPRPAATPATRRRWSPARSRWVAAAGILSFLAGVAFSVFIVRLRSNERADLASRTEVIGTVAHGEPDLRVAYQPPGAGRPLVAAVSAEDADVIDGRSELTVAFDPEQPAAVTLPERAPSSWTGRITGTVVHASGPIRIVFVPDGGRSPIVVDEPDRANGGVLRDGEAVSIFYEPDDASDVKLRESTLARDLTFWLIAIKLLVAGPVLVAFGVFRLRHPAPRTRQSAR